MPGPGCVWVYAMPPGGKSMRSQRMTHSANGSIWIRRESRAPFGLLRRVVELPDERVPVDVRLTVGGSVVRDVVDDAVPAEGLGAGPELVEGEPHRPSLSALSPQGRGHREP